MRIDFLKVKLRIGLVAVLLTLAIAPELLAQVTGRIYLEKESYAVGEPLFFTLEIKNAGREAVQFYPRNSWTKFG